MRWLATARSIAISCAVVGLGTTVAEETPRAKLSEELERPQQIQVAGKPLDVEREGHAAPHFADFDNDGLRDLLVGQYSEGKLRIYKNVGSNEEPQFDEFRYFRVDGKDATIPAD